MPNTEANRSPLAAKGPPKVNIFHEFIATIRFGLIGLLSTAVHITIVWLLLMFASVHPTFANTLAFLTAFCVSFIGNYLWTFRSPGNPKRAVFRFFLIAFGGFIINTMILLFLLQANWFSVGLSTVVAASAIPALNYCLSRLWAFREDKSK